MGVVFFLYLLVRKRITDNKMRKTAHPAPAMISVEYSLAIFGAKIPAIKTFKL